jgi:hypothetical protein
MTRSHPVFVKPLFAEMRAAVAGLADMPLESPQTPVTAVLVAKRADTAESTAPMRSGPCLVKWQSHEWTGPRGQCGRCGQERSYCGI